MGAVFVLVGLLSAGVLIDFLIENAPSQDNAVELFGSSFTVSQSEVAVAAFAAGAVAIALLFLGLRLMRVSWDRRRSTRRRLKDLERENEKLRSQDRVTSPTSEWSAT